MRTVFAAALLCAIGSAFDDKVKTIFGQRNNVDEHGNYVNPFRVHHDAEMIVYPDEGAFSVKMTPRMHNDPFQRLVALPGDAATTTTNSAMMYYTAPLYFTSSMTSFTLVVDTGSPETLVGVSTCTTCKGNTLAINSGTFAWGTATRTATFYGGINYDGTRCTEKVCTQNVANTCMTNFQLLCVTKTNDPATYDGRMGLGRPGTSYTG